MPDRKLHLIEHEDGRVEAEFMRYPQYGNPHYVRRLLMKNEISIARKLIKEGDIYKIDNFCYSIS